MHLHRVYGQEETINEGTEVHCVQTKTRTLVLATYGTPCNPVVKLRASARLDFTTTHRIMIYKQCSLEMLLPLWTKRRGVRDAS